MLLLRWLLLQLLGPVFQDSLAVRRNFFKAASVDGLGRLVSNTASASVANASAANVSAADASHVIAQTEEGKDSAAVNASMTHGSIDSSIVAHKGWNCLEWHQNPDGMFECKQWAPLSWNQDFSLLGYCLEWKKVNDKGKCMEPFELSTDEELCLDWQRTRAQQAEQAWEMAGVDIPYGLSHVPQTNAVITMCLAAAVYFGKDATQMRRQCQNTAHAAQCAQIHAHRRANPFGDWYRVKDTLQSNRFALYKNSVDHSCVLSFRGTDFTDIKDVVADGNIKMSNKLQELCGNGIHAYEATHQGFVDRAIEELNQFMVGNKEFFLGCRDDLFVTGHSLGGAVATLVAGCQNLWQTFGASFRRHLYTFGAPKVSRFGHEHADGNQIAPITIDFGFRYFNEGDPVPTLPPEGMPGAGTWTHPNGMHAVELKDALTGFSNPILGVLGFDVPTHLGVEYIKRLTKIELHEVAGPLLESSKLDKPGRDQLLEKIDQSITKDDLLGTVVKNDTIWEAFMEDTDCLPA